MEDLRVLTVERLIEWLRKTYKAGLAADSDSDTSEALTFNEIFSTCNSLKTFPWDYLLDLSTDLTKRLLRTLFFLFIRLFTTRKDVYLISLDALFQSLKKTLCRIQSSESKHPEWLSFLASFVSDVCVAVILSKTEASGDGPIKSLLSLQYTSSGRGIVGTRFVIEVLLYSLDFACYQPSEKVSLKYDNTRQGIVKRVVDSRGLVARKGETLSDTEPAFELEIAPILTSDLLNIQRIFARVIWEAIISLEHDSARSTGRDANCYQLLDDMSCLVASIAIRNSPMRLCLFRELGELLPLIAGSQSAPKFLALPYLFFLVSIDGRKASELLEEEIQRSVKQRLFAQATKLVLFYASYCVRAPMLSDVRLMGDEISFLREILKFNFPQLSQEQTFILFRHAVVQSIMYLFYFQQSRQGLSSNCLDQTLLSIVDLECLAPSILKRIRKKTSLDTSGYDFPWNKEKALSSLYWFPFDPCRLANLWDIVKKQGYNYVL